MRPVVGTAILLLVVLMITSTSAAWDPKPSCDAKYPPIPCRQKIGDGDWFQMGDKRCAKAFFNVPHLNFYDAEKACQKYRNRDIVGHLVSIHDIVELNQAVCIMYRVNTGKPHYWIGFRMTVNASGLTYAWTDDTKNTFTRWGPGQPDHYDYREECVEMNYWEWALWNDVECSLLRPYMCAVSLS